jgi:hypothetical protein
MTGAGTHAVIPAQAGTHDASTSFTGASAFGLDALHAQSLPHGGARLRGHDVGVDAIELCA